MTKCQKCGRFFKNKRAYNTHYSRMHRNTQKQEEINTSLDFNEIKMFITSEIQKAVKELNFSKPTIKNDNNNVGIVSFKPAKKMPKFDPVKVNKHLVVKELKEQLAKGIINILQEVGSFDNEIIFSKTPVLAKGIKNILMPKGSFDNEINFLKIPIEI